MARRIDTHLTQSGSEVQDILNWAHCSFPYPPSEVTSPIEGDICVVTEGYHKISIRPAEGATSFAFTVASKRVKWEVSEDYDLSDGTIASLTCQSSASEQTTYIIPNPSSRTGEVTAFSDAFTLQWVPDKAADLKYITLYGYYEAGVFEYVNGAWVERTDLAQTLEKAKSAYQKPASGIPASDIADGVIPDVSNFITKTVDDLVNYYTKTQTYTKEEVQQLVSSLSAGAFIPVAELPVASADTYGLKIYLVPSTDPQMQNVKDEFITIRSGSEGAYTYSWEQIGSTAIDLSDYATKDELPQTLVCGVYVIPAEYDETKDVAETATAFGITEAQVQELFDGVYKYIQFDQTVYTVTVVSKDPSWCVKFAGKDDMTEYTLWGITIAVGFIMLIGTRFRKDSAVCYTEQNLSAAKQAQARTNINAAEDGNYLIGDDSTPYGGSPLELESKANRVSSFQVTPDNSHYPTEKLVYDALQAQRIFWATYGTTTAAEIDAAVAANKVVMCIDGVNIFAMVSYDTNYYYFSFILNGGSYRRQLKRSDSSWARGTTTLQLVSNKVQTLTGNETNEIYYPSTKAVADALGKMGVVSQTQTWANDYSSYTISNVVRGLIPQSFIDAWNHLVMSFGTFNETTGYFELNGLTDISYKEALVIKEKYTLAVQAEGWRPNSFSYSEMEIFSARTSIPIRVAGQVYPYLTWNTHIEVAKFSISDADYTGTFLGYGCYRLKRIMDILKQTSATNLPLFRALEECYFKIANNFSAPNSPFLSLQSIVYLVDNAFNGSNLITITLHATAYARCQADTTEYTYNEQTYTGIIAYAAAKNITIQSAT